LQHQLFDPTKYGLALHTTTPELGLAMSNFAGDIRSNVWNLERELSSYLHQYLSEFIKPQTWADLAFIAVAKGPGGFTGTRIGVVTARTLGQQLNIPVFAISNLAAVAWSQIPPNPPYQGGNPLAKGDLSTPLIKGGKGDLLTPLSKGGRGELSTPGGNGVIAVEMPAQRGQIFAAIYQPIPDAGELKVLLPDSVFTKEAWLEKLANWNTNYQLIEAKSDLAATVTSVLELAHLDWQMGKRPHWSEALPYYGQHPVNI
jgi:tRNA threonylcarbamoyl adenosine modification protein YeaZ